MEQAEITIIGAGIVGLAVAFELSKAGKDVLVIEKELSFGQGISSRNSEVIHAGIYYPKDSLKTKTCVEGRELLYDFCAKENVGYKRTGKLIVAARDDETGDLEKLFKNGRGNGVADLKLLTQAQIKDMEPNVRAVAGIYSPSTGIIDSHGFMKKLEAGIESRGGRIAYNTEVTGIEKDNSGFRISVEDKREGSFSFLSRIVVNSAGLYSDKIAALAGVENNEYKLKYCKGDYFRVAAAKSKLINRLVYPVPKKEGAGLGVHATLDLAGGLRLGPDDEYVDKIYYDIDESKKKAFSESAKSFMPFIEEDDLSPDTAGIRPKLQGKGEGFRDFIIKEESGAGLPGLINLIGIESPGLTSSLSIAKIVAGIIRR